MYTSNKNYVEIITIEYKTVVTNVFTQNTDYSSWIIGNITAFLDSIKKKSEAQGYFYELS